MIVHLRLLELAELVPAKGSIVVGFEVMSAKAKVVLPAIAVVDVVPISRASVIP